MPTLFGRIYGKTSYKIRECRLLNSGLFNILTSAGLLVRHEEVSQVSPQPDIVYKIIKPVAVPFISYPWEWSFSQLKDAALITLLIQRKALQREMSLKDCSAFNVQFINAQPVFIDTLSFEPYHEGRPWVAYRQFCQHFLAPLALMSRCDIRLQQLWHTNIDGIPLDLTSKLLPLRSWFNFSLLTHLHLHASSQKYYADKSADTSVSAMVSRNALLGIIDIQKRTDLFQLYTCTKWGNDLE